MRLCSLGFRHEQRPRKLFPNESSYSVHLPRWLDAVMHSSRKPGYFWSSGQTLMSPTRYPCSRDAGSQDWAVIDSSTQISNESLEGCAVCNWVRFPERSMCETARITPKMLTQEAWRSWDINQGKLEGSRERSPRRKSRPQPSEAISSCQSFETPISPPLDLHAGHRAEEFNACFSGFYLAVVHPSPVLLLVFSLGVEILVCLWHSVLEEYNFLSFSFLSYFWIQRHSWEFFLKVILDLNFLPLQELLKLQGRNLECLRLFIFHIRRVISY